MHRLTNIANAMLQICVGADVPGGTPVSHTNIMKYMNKLKNKIKFLAGLAALVLTVGQAVAQPSTPQEVITGRAWLDIGGTAVANLTGDARFPDNYDVQVWLPYFEWNPDPSGDIEVGANNAYGDNYGAQILGYFHPPATGEYTFWLSADDGSDLFLSTDSDPANKKLIAQESGWSGVRNWESVGGGSTLEDKNSSTFAGTEWPDTNADGGATITLQQGQAYYIEALVKEGGGGDNLAVAVEDPNGIIDPFLPIPGEFLSSHVPSGPLTITGQPAGTTVDALESVTLSVEVSGTPPYSFQWAKDGTDIDGATSASYTVDRVTTDNAGSYTVAVTGADGSATSDAAVVAVNSDDVAPTLTFVTGSETFTVVKVTFSEPVDAATGGDASNYKLSGGVSVTDATVADAPNDNTVILTTSKQDEGTMLNLTVTKVQDLFGNAIAAATMEFSTFVWQEGVVLHKFWENMTTNNLDGLRADPRFPDNPTWVSLEPYWEYGPDGSNESGSNYGNQLVGWFVPPDDGNYIFFTNSDDPSDLFLSTDDDPANKLVIARESGWSNARSWNSVGGTSEVDDKRSDFFIDSEWPTLDISLNGGERYYLESIHTEGGGGDSVAATVISSLDPDPTDGDAPTLTGSLIGTYLDPNGAEVTIEQQPSSVTIDEGQSVTLTIGASGTSAYGNSVGIQWQTAAAGSSDFSDVAGATTDSLDTGVLTTADTGVQFRVVLTVPTVTATSDVATVTVESDGNPPSIVGVSATSANTLIVRFNERIDEASGSQAGNFSLSGGVNVSGAQATGSTVLLTTGDLTPGAAYTLTAGGVNDLFGNALAAGSTKDFTVNIVTYTDIILEDGPIVFYTFDGDSGQVSSNHGTLGSDADGLWMSGAGPDDSFEWDVTTEEGPNSSEGFLGFAGDNQAASFNGDLDAIWIDAQGSWLSDLDSFTLEYWVKPTNREDNGWSRVGIVGQNDTVEYGFINGTTIQIWTPGGGSLNTTYEFPDDEWHHVATIADGGQIVNYFDGVLINSGGGATANYGAADFNVHIGGGGVYDATGNHFEGAIDAVAIFNKAIPGERVEEHFRAGREGGSIAEATGIDIAWVSFHPADNEPGADAAAAGFTEAADKGYTDLLRKAGHNVTRVQTSGTPDVAALNEYDLVIISRSVPSGDYQDAAEAAAWNSVETPILIFGGYILRTSRLGYTTGTTMVDTDRVIKLLANDPNHPIFADIALDGDGLMVNDYAGIVTALDNVQRGVSINNNPIVGGGKLVATVGTSDDPTVGGMVIGEFAAGTTLANGGADTLSGHRMVFLTGSREQGFTSQGAGIYDLEADGAKLFLNAVNYMTSLPDAPAGGAAIAIANDGGNIAITYEGTLQSADSVTGPYSDVAGASSPFSVTADAPQKFYRAVQ